MTNRVFATLGGDGATLVAPRPKSRIFASWQVFFKFHGRVVTVEIMLMTVRRWEKCYADDASYSHLQPVRIKCAPPVLAVGLFDGKG